MNWKEPHFKENNLKNSNIFGYLFQNKLVELQMSFADQSLQRSTESSRAHLSLNMKDRPITEVKLMEAEFDFGLKR